MFSFFVKKKERKLSLFIKTFLLASYLSSIEADLLLFHLLDNVSSKILNRIPGVGAGTAFSYFAVSCRVVLYIFNKRTSV